MKTLISIKYESLSLPSINRFQFGSFHSWFNIEFLGPKSRKLKKRWEKHLEIEEEEYKVGVIERCKKQRDGLEKELSLIPNRFWNKSDRRKLKEEIKQKTEIIDKPYSLGAESKVKIAQMFLLSIGAKLIKEETNFEIYEY